MEPKPPVLDFMKPSRGKEKGKQSHFSDAEPSKFSITGRGKNKDAKADPAAQPTLDKDAVYSVVSHMERTLFIVDLSKLEAEGDTLIGSLVMYRPYYEFKKVKRPVELAISFKTCLFVCLFVFLAEPIRTALFPSDWSFPVHEESDWEVSQVPSLKGHWFCHSRSWQHIYYGKSCQLGAPTL